MSELQNQCLSFQNQKFCYTTCITCYKVTILFFIMTKACFSEQLKFHLKLGNNPFPSPLKIAKKILSSVLKLGGIKEKGIQNVFCETKSVSMRLAQIFFLPQQLSNTSKVEIKTIKATRCEDCRTEKRKISAHPTLIQFSAVKHFPIMFVRQTLNMEQSQMGYEFTHLSGYGESFRNIPLI